MPCLRLEIGCHLWVEDVLERLGFGTRHKPLEKIHCRAHGIMWNKK
jgi:hypothetical protein